MTSVCPLESRVTSLVLATHSGVAATTGRTPLGAFTESQMRSLLNRRTNASRQRSNNSLSVREWRHAAAKALASVARAGSVGDLSICKCNIAIVYWGGRREGVVESTPLLFQ